MADAGASIAGLNLLAGGWLFISHWVLNYGGADPVWNDVIFGIVVAAVALVRMSGGARARFASWLNAAVGVWLFISAFVIASSSAAMTNNIVLGVIVFVLAIAAAMAGRTEQSQR
jgi:hypothetical protein